MKIKTIVVQILLLALWFFIGWRVRELTLSSDIISLEQLRTVIENNVYYKNPPPSPSELTFAASRGMVNLTDDPRAVFMEPNVAKEYMKDKQSLRAGIGFKIAHEDDRWVVTFVNPGEQAEKAGLKVGDILLKIDDTPVEDYTTYIEISMLIRGEPGTPVTLTVLRNGQQVRIDAIRKNPEQVRIRMIGTDIAYLRQDEFSIPTADLMKNKLQKLLDNNPKGLIWDLRYNGGGTKISLLRIMGFFFKDGPIFYEKTRDGEPRLNLIEPSDFTTDIPLVVLIDKNTYSSPEVASSAIQYRHRGILVGGSTFGKGTITQFFLFANGSALQLSTEHWLTLSKEWLEGKGVSPDIYIQDDPQTPDDEQLNCAIAILRNQNQSEDNLNSLCR